MAKHKFSVEEVKQWQAEHYNSLFYINNNDSNLFVKRWGKDRWEPNFAHPAVWAAIAFLVALILLRIFL